jgi:hypothetical protein
MLFEIWRIKRVFIYIFCIPLFYVFFVESCFIFDLYQYIQQML